MLFKYIKRSKFSKIAQRLTSEIQVTKQLFFNIIFFFLLYNLHFHLSLPSSIIHSMLYFLNLFFFSLFSLINLRNNKSQKTCLQTLSTPKNSQLCIIYNQIIHGLQNQHQSKLHQYINYKGHPLFSKITCKQGINSEGPNQNKQRAQKGSLINIPLVIIILW